MQDLEVTNLDNNSNEVLNYTYGGAFRDAQNLQECNYCSNLGKYIVKFHRRRLTILCSYHYSLHGGGKHEPNNQKI